MVQVYVLIVNLTFVGWKSYLRFSVW